MAKTAQQRIGEQMSRLGIDPKRFATIQAEYDAGKFPAKDKGTGKVVRQYLKQTHPDWITKQEAPKSKTPAVNIFDTSRKDFNITEAMKAYKADPEGSTALAKAAGWKIK